MASFSIPLTGLEADSTALNTIANDLSNMNTTAFKAQTTNFSDLFYQQIGNTGAGDPIQVGAGTQVAANSTAYTQGTINSTGNATDVALNGNGFFVVGNGEGGYELTRAGDFSQDTNGYLLTTSGQNVMGYPAVNGVVNPNAALAPVNIPVGQVQEPQATGTFGMTANLDAESTTGTQFPAPVTIYDSLGEAHVATVTYTQTAPNTWSYSAALPASDFASGVSTPVTGTLNFDSNGNLTTITPTAGAAETVGTASGDVSSIPVSFTGLADGASDLNMQWNVLGPSGTPTVSQVATGSAVSSTTQSGYPSGQYQSFTIGSDGTVTVTYSNGQRQNVGQIALANVENLQGLQLLGDGNYGTTLASGTASVGVSGTSGLATLQDGALEASNVNISSEFSNLIVAQRAFEANAKSVTTFDTVTQDTINMVH
ncbi:MAG TPA: flagellar hook protein FlgE [Terracidiphilus sp.]|jgi:flagellar hook protein FlgE|nr:flagellar hook protein FlgE [Terracidiphilus sp.]